MIAPARSMPWPEPDPSDPSETARQNAPPEPQPASLLTREWLITNGLGGYASGTLSGAPTRRYHGLLVAAQPAPLGRMLMLCQLEEVLRLPDGSIIPLGGEEDRHAQERALRLELGLAGLALRRRTLPP